MKLITTTFLKREMIRQENCILQVYCEQTQRYFAIYEAFTPRKPEEGRKVFNDMVKSFRCHPSS